MSPMERLAEYLTEEASPKYLTEASSDQIKEHVKTLLGKSVFVTFPSKPPGRREFRGLLIDEHDSLCVIVSLDGDANCEAVHFSRVAELWPDVGKGK